MKLNKLHKNEKKKSDKPNNIYWLMKYHKDLIHKPQQAMDGELEDSHTPISPTSFVGAAPSK
jgi:hypothetical protein